MILNLKKYEMNINKHTNNATYSYVPFLILLKVFDIGLMTRFLTKSLEKYYSATSSTVFVHVSSISPIHLLTRHSLSFTHLYPTFLPPHETSAELKPFRFGVDPVNVHAHHSKKREWLHWKRLHLQATRRLRCRVTIIYPPLLLTTPPFPAYTRFTK